ncbi:MAG: hypothetical protein DHS20C18_55420 [Saprospiraceae bacterium]|nr:MAG: hypothetical protein DHS20C18_55420 [Saprospiraceae bacterium]
MALGAMLNAQVIYVNQNAAGANTGTTWTNAYNDLTDALNDASATEIWIATGTYKPGGNAPDTLSRYSINRNLSLYGGFAGTEGSIDERDIESNPTTLSGDINGDDEAMNFDNFKEDNVLHVVYVDSLIEGFVTFDGLNIQGGHNNPFISGVNRYLYSGGGIYALSTIFVNQCHFAHNYSSSGAAINLVGPEASESSIEFSDFTQNRATDQATVYLSGLTTGGVRYCNFTNNVNNRGALYPADCSNLEIDNCLFENNSNPSGYGGGLFSWQNTFLILTNSTFTGNTAQNAGGIYVDGRELGEQNPDHIVINNCTFNNNSTSDYGGGGCYFFRSSYRLSNTTFDNNIAANSGGAIVNGGDDKVYFIENCAFLNGSANFGSGMTNYGANSFGAIRDCLFEANTAGTSGGGMINGFLSDVTVEDCDFINNDAGWGAGMYNQNDNTRVSVSGSYFSGNSVINSGGAINISGGIDFTINNSDFFGNQANFGGAVAITEDSLDLAHLSIRNSVFNLNVAAQQGGAVNINDTDTEITSCLFANNIAADPGTGGAISANISGTSTMEARIFNSTFAFNIGTIANGIAAYTEEEATLNVTLQNNIFYNPDGLDYAIEAGNPTVTSLGGNFSSDLTMLEVLTNIEDIVDENLNPSFVDEGDDDFHLTAESPCVDNGIDAGAPSVDLEGNPRVGTVDIGAYEYQGPDGIREVLLNNNDQLKLSPNPAVDEVQITLNNDWKGKIQLRLLSASGQVMGNFEVNKYTAEVQLHKEIHHLPAGVYQLSASNGSQLLVLPFVKL